MIIPINKPDGVVSINTPFGGNDSIKHISGGIITFKKANSNDYQLFDYYGKQIASYVDVTYIGPVIDGKFSISRNINLSGKGTNRIFEIVDVNTGKTLLSSNDENYEISSNGMVTILKAFTDDYDRQYSLLNLDSLIEDDSLFNEIIQGGDSKYMIGLKSSDELDYYGLKLGTLLSKADNGGFDKIDKIDGMSICFPNNDIISSDWGYLYSNENGVKKQGIVNIKTGFKLIKDDIEFISTSRYTNFTPNKNLLQVSYEKDSIEYIMIIDENGKELFNERVDKFNCNGNNYSDRIQVKDGYGLIFEKGMESSTVKLLTPEGNMIDLAEEMIKTGYLGLLQGLNEKGNIKLKKSLFIDFVKDGVICFSIIGGSEDIFFFMSTDGKFINNSKDDHLSNISGTPGRITNISLLDDGKLFVNFYSGDNSRYIMPFNDVFTNFQDLKGGFYSIEGKEYFYPEFDIKSLIPDGKTDKIKLFLDKAKEVKDIDDSTIEINSKKYNKKLLKSRIK